ncbi:MAG TPA: tetratricopeptide repeat protein [Tetrasphaera sp.]|nr:tetratricopeptide repeat protein [Tetrasphaera sp.]
MLNSYAIRRAEALAPADEALACAGVLAEANSAAYTPDLAMALNNYANRLAEVGRRDEAEFARN